MQLLEFIFGIAVLILVHEIGHFIAARLLKVKVDEFGVGLPPRFIGTAHDTSGRRRWFGVVQPNDINPNETVLSLNWIPLGGFVRPRGENDPSIPGGLAAASPWVRLGVIFAGPLMNLLVGIVLGALLFYSMGERIPEKVLVSYIAPGSPAAAADLRQGDLFLAVNSQKIDSIEKLQSIIDLNLGQRVEIQFQRGESLLTVSLVPRTNPPEGEGPMGVGLDNPTRPINLWTALGRGGKATYETMRGILLLPVRLLKGQASPQEGRLVGYKGMYDIYQRIQNPLWFFMMISISLGIMNLLPIPAVDGGRILLTLPEILVRRRVPAQYENMIHMVGLVALLILLIYINLQDFINPLKLP
jgi:regulator of sigma E protease